MSFDTTSDNNLVQMILHAAHISEGIVIVANKGCQVELEFAMPNHGQLHRKL
jgi:hypothetical protein